MRWLAAALLFAWMPIASASTLFEDLGGRDKIAAFTGDFVERVASDPRIERYFIDTDKPGFARKLTDLFCHLAGEDRLYRGANLRNAHSGLGISAADFNALVEDLQAAMEANGVSFADETRLVALLAPMQRDVVNQP